MATKSKSKTQVLQEELDNYKKWLRQSEETNQKLRNQAEDSFLNSPTYNQMQEKISFMDSLIKLNEYNIKRLESQKEKVTETIQQVYSDNKAMMEHYKEGENFANPYFIGLTENWHDASEYMKLKFEISELKGKIRGLETLLSDRDNEIERLQGVVGNLRRQIDLSSISFIEQNIEQDKQLKISNQKKRGRPQKINESQISLIKELHNNGHSIRTIAKQLGLATGTVQRYLK